MSKTATLVATKLSSADTELQDAIAVMNENAEISPSASDWAVIPDSATDVAFSAIQIHLMSLRRIAIALRPQILSEGDSPYNLPPLVVDGRKMSDSFKIRALARFNDADFDRMLRQRSKKLQDVDRLFRWAGDTLQPEDQNGNRFLKTQSEEMAEWRAQNAANARRSIETKKSNWQEFTPREITSELVSSANNPNEDSLPESEIHEIVRSVIRSYRQSNPEFPPFITVNRDGNFSQVFIEQATPDDLENFVNYRRQQALDMTASADMAQKLLNLLHDSVEASQSTYAAA